jgi:cytochrome oxidase assembly protein ShyY1
VSSTREHPAVTDEGRPRRRLAFLASPGWIGIILAVLAFSAACFFILAPWQFGRNAERTAQNNAVDASITAPAVPVAELMSTSAQPPGDVAWRVVTATGEFDPTRQVQVRLRQDENGNPVSEVIAPFRMANGQTLLVDRGYVSFTDVRNDVPIAALPTGQVTITGRVQDEQTDPSNRQPLVVGDHTEAYAINVAAIGGAEESEVFLQGYIQLTGGSPGVLTPIELPQTDSGPFLSYALQWEAFGIIALIGLGVFIYREIADPRPPDDRDQPGDPVVSDSPDADVTVTAAPAGSQRRRRPRDGFDRSQLYDD